MKMETYQSCQNFDLLFSFEYIVVDGKRNLISFSIFCLLSDFSDFCVCIVKFITACFVVVVVVAVVVVVVAVAVVSTINLVLIFFGNFFYLFLKKNIEE